MISLINKILGSLEARVCQPRVSIWRTVYFNFRTLPFGLALKFPIFIYGKHRLFMLHGRVCINGDIKRGMIKIGVNGDSFSLFDHSGFIQLGNRNSIIKFDGPCRIALNTKIRVVNGILHLGAYSRIGTNCRVICNGGNISIGNYSGITFDCQIMNSGFHYIYDIEKKGYINRSSDIFIGSFNWIGNHTLVNAGTLTPDYAIVAQGSLLNKNYKSYPSYSLFAGSPAKFIKDGVKRVFSPETEIKISKLFNNSSEIKFVEHSEFEDDYNLIRKEL